MRRGKKFVERVGQGTSWKNASERNGNVRDCAYPLYARDCPGRPNTRERAPSNTEGRRYPKRATPNACTCGCVGERGGGGGGWVGCNVLVDGFGFPTNLDACQCVFHSGPIEAFRTSVRPPKPPFWFPTTINKLSVDHPTVTCPFLATLALNSQVAELQKLQEQCHHTKAQVPHHPA
ncbi:conserved hypothetical protein, unlikely [Trypanosoma brucei gambiense DAL972]|uniref:Uncharacterized protein n=1 Tax=Trypanosoma brucei gambiense (strain MHOM/CI/86/DAL972) TaxID=679716 RepID=C9ZXH3_TRYB9|nr:conserved hypothetical protein, unlikely [Trypanosoma brucei gambiense DAL972]CBH14117.1 conserved hypothetical protein, unlikely [Trypanosoma brucei gambiense DAL972]|eukprot:XP_011776388.1 conserved hypothetical protein, unlikely [Trypanosoma brucei gambiense DAL972]